MAGLITADELRERFDIDSDIRDERLTPHIASARVRLRSWLGGTVYDATIALGDDVDQKLVLKNAEAHLVMHFAILGLNSPLSTKGVVATSMSAEGKEMRKYLLPKETAEIAMMYLETADEIARPYRLAVEDAVPVVNQEVEDIYWERA